MEAASNATCCCCGCVCVSGSITVCCGFPHRDKPSCHHLQFSTAVGPPQLLADHQAQRKQQAMALANRTSSHTASSSSSPAGAGPPPRPVDQWGPNSSCRACLSDLAAVVVVLVCFSCVALCLRYAAGVLLRCLHRHRRRAAREEAQAQAQEPKPLSDADGGSAGASPVVAGVWAEAECAICLAELDDDLEGGGERVRVRVLPACGHGFHAACVEAWLATRASCPTCRAPSSSRSRPSRTTRQP
ncbi:hypothetical protein BDA96_02G200600 [Sorghum bicolor]|uniref:RING-type domain-containing protein n=1 Tax=Sorghum bicolor TaxID=4558 RepID=A0A921RPI8_SORBI|nr:hypothetical protein BDA96_02G200600 [Sorghum bicolor]